MKRGQAQSNYPKALSAYAAMPGRLCLLGIRLSPALVPVFIVLTCIVFITPASGQEAIEEPEPETLQADPEIARADSSLPRFLFEGFYATNHGDVIGVYPAETADVVLVRGGFDSGFRNGMMCLVRDQDDEIAEIMLVDVRHNCAAGLITNLEPGRVIESGNLVRIKAVR